MRALYTLLQWTWALPQTLTGFVLFLLHRKEPHWFYHGALITEWSSGRNLSLGMFIFLTRGLTYRGTAHILTAGQLSARMRVHEYGHTIQSLILGPLYLLIVGIPSAVWASSARLGRMRREKQVSYFSLYTERWANSLGERFTGEPSMEQLFID